MITRTLSALDKVYVARSANSALANLRLIEGAVKYVQAKTGNHRLAANYICLVQELVREIERLAKS